MKKTCETEVFVDQFSGRDITRLTNYNGHSWVHYFTDNYWIDEDRFVIGSDRNGKSDLFTVDLKDRTVARLTDLNGSDRPQGLYCAARGTFVFWYGNELLEIDPDRDGDPSRLYRVADSFEHAGGFHAISPDGRTAYIAVRAAQSAGRHMQYNKSLHYRESSRMPAESRILAIDLSSGREDTLFRDVQRIEHVNASPAAPDLLTFCHEGPWADVAQRIWGLRVSTGEVWPIRPQSGDLAVGHEFFTHDGKWIGYHGRRLPEQRIHTFGFVRPDNSEMLEHDFPFHCTHFTSFGLDYALGDGTPANVQPWFASKQKPYLMLFRRNGHTWDGPRVLAFHRATFNEQIQHPHARFSNDGTRVVYSSDVGGYSNVYIVDVEPFDDLPTVEECNAEWQ